MRATSSKKFQKEAVVPGALNPVVLAVTVLSVSVRGGGHGLTNSKICLVSRVIAHLLVIHLTSYKMSLQCSVCFWAVRWTHMVDNQKPWNLCLVCLPYH